MITGLNNAALTFYQTAAEKGFYDDGLPPIPERLMLIVTEIAEVMEEYRAGKPVKLIYYNNLDLGAVQKPEGIPIELADAVIRILDFCGAVGIDLEHAIELKHNYNKTRPRKHGKTC